MLDCLGRKGESMSQRIMMDKSPGCGYRIRFFCLDFICFPVALAAASADPIAIRVNPLHHVKHRDYPDRVIFGDGIVVNRFFAI